MSELIPHSSYIYSYFDTKFCEVCSKYHSPMGSLFCKAANFGIVIEKASLMGHLVQS